MINQFTFQVNLSPGDVQYAAITVRELAKQHLTIPNRLLIVDCCKPQKTKLVNPALRFPEPAFSNKVDAICKLADEFMQENLFTQLHILMPGDKIFKKISKKYLNNVIKTTHGAGGTAQMAYWAGIELATTRYIIHYDGDMILYQENGFQWWEEAVRLMELEKGAIMAIPRHAPPTESTGDFPTFFEGTEIIAKEKYWLHNWFSTRNFLLDKFKLEEYLPLVKGKLLIELLLRKLPFRAFPLDPEIIFFRRLGITESQRRLILKTTKAWTLHPLTKPEKFIQILPELYASVNKKNIPTEQCGNEDIVLNTWLRFLNA